MSNAASVLIVEDDDDLQAMLVDAFTGSGFDVKQTNDGHKALAILQKNYLDALILDINIPGLNGLSLLSKIKSSALVTVTISGFDDVEADHAYNHNADIFLRKPLSPNDVIAVTNKFLKQRRPLRDVQSKISTREKHVLDLIAEGYTADQIAMQLDISAYTVFKHRASIRRKFKGMNFVQICQLMARPSKNPR